MKKNFIAISLLVAAMTLNAVETTTQTKFYEPTISQDKYGNTVYVQDAEIQTHNFKVQNFWKGFSFGGDGETQKNYNLVSRRGTFKITVESTSACALNKNLPEEGCSGQKPFLLNNEALSASTNADGNYEVVFTEAAQYSNSDAQAFYPLDILRDTKYYQDPLPSDPNANIDRGFFGFFTSAFDFVFSKTIGFGSDYFGNPQIADVQYGPRSTAAEDRRQRYIANIMAGVEKKYRLTMPASDSSATLLNAGVRLNDPVSLLHYAEAKKTVEQDQCKFMFLNLSSDGLMCRMMGGFGMNAWMPFFKQAKITQMETSTIMADTENSLLAMTGEIEKVPYMDDSSVSNEDNNTKLSFLHTMIHEVSKPMSATITMVKTMMFGPSKASKVADPVYRTYSFDDDKAMTLNFAITNDGAKVDSFQNFKLMKIRSVYGDMIDSCEVRKNPGMFSWSSWRETFTIGGTNSKRGPDGSMMSSDEWVDWCQEATGRRGMFSYLFDWSSGAVFNPLNWMKGFFSAFLSFLTGSYDILDFKSQVDRGLILELKKVQLDPVSPYNRRIIEIQKIQ